MLIEAMEKLPKLNSIDTQIVLGDLYERKFGIRDGVRKSPLESVAFYQPEEYTSTSPLPTFIDQYVKKNIKDLFGLNLVEFLDLTPDILSIVIEVADSHNSKKVNALAEIESEFATPKK